MSKKKLKARICACGRITLRHACDKCRLRPLKPRLHEHSSRLTPMQVATPRDRGRPWRRRRAAWLQAHPLCTTCEANGRVEAATEVDHVTPLWMGGPDEDINLQSMCSPCHLAKSAREAKERGGW